MDSVGWNQLKVGLSREEDLPLDKVLKPRQTGKKLPEEFSSESENCIEEDLVKKNKPIIKEQKDQKPKEQKEQKIQNLPPTSSVELIKQLILDQNISIKEAEELLIKLKNIKSLKYDKLSERIRENLIEIRFKNSYSSFIKVISAYTKEVGSTHLLHSIFHGFELAWRSEKFETIEIFEEFLKLYLETVPNCLNKRFVKWMKDRLMVANNRNIYVELRKKVTDLVKRVVNTSRRQNSSENEKIIGFVVYFELWDSIDMKQLVKIVPLQKINEYMELESIKFRDNDETIREKFEFQKNKNHNEQKMEEEKGKKLPLSKRELSSSSSNDANNMNTVPPLVHHSILELIQKNDLKEVEKILKSYKVSHLLYPEFVKKLEMKYLEYAERTNPIYVIDELVHGKINLVEGLIDIYSKKRKYDHVEHFTHKYKLRGIDQPNSNKIFINPLKHQDSFGPTESHVLNQRPETYFLRLLDFEVPKSNVVWIDTLTIFQKPFTSHLKKLLFTKEVGLDSESTSGIHVFEKSKLQLIQIYEPESNVVLLFDVQDFKNDKKKRNRKNNSSKEEVKKQSNSEKLSNVKKDNIESEESKLGRSMSQPIDLEEDENDDKIEQENKVEEKRLEEEKVEEENKAWYRFTKIIENVFKNSTIYGHVLHSDLGDIITELNLSLKPNNLKFKDSQTEFKKYYPKETKSKLSFLTETCFGKEISKFEQCGAWDKRPLRNAQKHYAALDAVLPYKLVKWMEEKFSNQLN